MRLLGVMALAATAAAMSVSPKSDPCDRVECRAGRECLVSGGVAQCLCVTECPDHIRPVCGSDDKSYDNHCSLHQHACLTGEHISVDYRGYCKKDIELALREFGITTSPPPTTTTTTTTAVPITTTEPSELAVCYGPQRDALRDSIITQWQASVKLEPWYTKDMSYKESLSGHFFSCDTDRDYKLRPDELIDCFDSMPFSSRPEQDVTITRTLCIDALVEDVDVDKDWRLNFQEFTHLLDPLYLPRSKNCSLEGRDYTDGAEVYVECNHCVCATGSWVCATHECHDKKDHFYGKAGNALDFGYMDTKYDIDDDSDEALIDIDSYEDDEDYNDIDKDEAKKEYNWLTPAEKKKLHHLEDNIKKFYSKLNGSSVDADFDEEDYDDSEESDETSSEEEEDDLLDEYDDLLDKSEMVRNKLHSLRDSIRQLEEKRAAHKRQRESSKIHINSIHHDKVSAANKPEQKYNAHKTALLAKLQRDKQRAQTDNSIWEDQWKAEVKKHQRTNFNNHL